MLHTRKVVVMVLASAGLVFAIGLPALIQKHRTPAEYIANEVATTEEIQDFDLMWNGLESLQKKANELGPEEYKEQFIGSTTSFLQLDADQTVKFVNVVNEALEKLGDARDRWNRANQRNLRNQGDASQPQADEWSGQLPQTIAERRDAWAQWRDDQRETSDLMLGVLKSSPRHNLLAERRLFWLLKLDFSMRKAKNSQTHPVSYVTINGAFDD